MFDLRNPWDPSHGDNAHQEEDEPQGVAGIGVGALNHCWILGVLAPPYSLFSEWIMLWT